MYSNLTKHRKNIAVLALLIAIVMVSLSGRLGYLMLFCSEHYSAMAEDLHQRERTIKAARGVSLTPTGSSSLITGQFVPFPSYTIR